MEPTDLSRHWGQRLRGQRVAAGLTASALAQQCGLKGGRATIHSYEVGRRTPDDATRVALARALETRVADLFPYPDADGSAA